MLCNPCCSVFVVSFCLKGEALDGKSEAVIDYTPYLKFTQRWGTFISYSMTQGILQGMVWALMFRFYLYLFIPGLHDQSHFNHIVIVLSINMHNHWKYCPTGYLFLKCCFHLTFLLTCAVSMLTHDWGCQILLV